MMLIYNIINFNKLKIYFCLKLLIFVGWQYSVSVDIGKFGVLWSANKKPFHTMRRQRLLRTRKNIDPAFLRNEEVLSRKY